MLREVMGNGNDYAAVVADNTSSMRTTMFAALFDSFASLWYIGCCVHCLDLLNEDLAKIPELKEIIDEVHWITVCFTLYA